MKNFIQENLQELSSQPRILRLLEDCVKSPKPAEYSLELAKNQFPTLIIKTEKGRSFTYHSRYNPQDEAKKQIRDITETHSHFIFLGMGLGYAVEEVLNRLQKPEFMHQVIVIEPDPWVFSNALYARDMRKMLSDTRVDWCVKMEPDEFGDFWNNCLDWSAINNLGIIEHPPSISRFPEYFERVKEKIRFFGQRSKGNLVTLMYNGFEFLTNNFLNLNSVVKHPGVGRLFGKFVGIPAIVVAAGPSLDKNVGLLSKIKDRFLIVAVDTALRPLIAHGIRPDIVCAGDSSYLNSLDFVGVEDEKDVILAFEPMTHPDIPDFFQGPKLLMNFGGGVAPWLEKFRETIGFVGCWGSIATTAFDLARRFGCDPIVFIGLDLSFQDGRLHARGSFSDDTFFDNVHPYTSIEHETAEYILSRGEHRLIDKDGQVIYTDQSMNLYRNWFEDQFRQTSQAVINSTEGGIVEKFTRCVPLAEVIETYWEKGGPVNEVLRFELTKELKVDLGGLFSEIEEVLKYLRLALDKAQRGLDISRKLAKNHGKICFSQLLGVRKAQMEDMLSLHDDLCGHALIFSWLTVWQTRLITRHTMEITSLKNRKEVLVEEWAFEMELFFTTIIEFFKYLTPLIDSAFSGLKRNEPVKPESQGGQVYGIS